MIHQSQLGVELCFQLVHSVFEGHILSNVTPIALVIMRFQIDMNWITFMVGQMIIDCAFHVVTIQNYVKNNILVWIIFMQVILFWTMYN